MRPATFRVEGLAARLAPVVWDGRIPDLIGASFVRNSIQLRVPEADINVRVHAAGPTTLHLTFEAVFRECGLDSAAGGTWWDSWQVTVEPRAPGDTDGTAEAMRVLADQVLAARRRFAVLLADASQAA
ncbi:hypothetical protein ABZ845_06985 [Streptomyces sp. NPDC047022]|uniref:hypothetical protein n=1 Tax=Streptomyces sp. NPDC047022 TaxID=3155737 RepID=UPI0033EC3900